MSGAPRLTAAISEYRTIDGWRSGIAQISDGKRYEAFLSPSGKLRLYAPMRESRGCNFDLPVGPYALRRRRAVREAFEAIPFGGGAA